MQVGESLVQIYQHGCSYFQLCDHAALSSCLTVLFIDTPDIGQKQPEWAIGLPPLAQASKCYAKERVELYAPQWKEKVCLLQDIRHYATINVGNDNM